MICRTILGIALALTAAATAQAEVSVNTHKTKNMNCVAGVCTPTAKGAFLNVNDLVQMLATSDVTITTGAGAVTIGIDSPLTWTSAHRLTLDAAYNVAIKAPVVVEGTGGALTVTTSDGVTGGDLLFFPGGKIDFWDLSSSLIVNGATFTLVPDVGGLSVAAALDMAGNYAFSQDHDASLDGQYRHAPVRSGFTGIIEGLGHTVSHLTLAIKDSAAGLVAQSSGTIRDIRLTDVNVKARSGLAGAVVGENDGLLVGDSVDGKVADSRNTTVTIGGLAGSNTGTIRRCDSSGTIGGSLAGGLAGSTTGSIEDSSSTARVTAPFAGGSGPFGAGGLAGDVSGTISNSHATGDVGDASNAYPAGGLVAILEPGGTIDGSSAAGNVASLYYWAGGLVATSAGIVRNSFATGTVSANAVEGFKTPAGGLVGYNTGTIADSYARGATTTGQGDVGGLVGQSFGQIASAYSTGAVTANQTSGSNIGGFIGSDFHSGGIKKSYWNMDTSGVANPAQGAGNVANDSGIAGLSDAQLKAHLPHGFDPAVWGQNAAINDGYPYLLANAPQ